MSNSHQDSGILGAVAAVCLLALIGGGFFMYQRARTAQAAVMEAELKAVRAIEAEAALKAAAAAAEQARARAEKAAAEALVAQQAQTAAAQATLPKPSIALEDWSVQQDTPAVQAEIHSKLMTQQADWNKGDLDAFMKVYWNSDKLTFASGGKITRGYQATLDGYKSKYSTKEKLGSLTFADLEYQRLAESVMLVLGTWHLDRGDDSVGGNFSLIWSKIDGQWLIIHDHTSALTKP